MSNRRYDRAELRVGVVPWQQVTQQITPLRNQLKARASTPLPPVTMQRCVPYARYDALARGS